VVSFLFLASALVGCKAAPSSQAGRDDLATSAGFALSEMRNADRSLNPFMKNAYGYAMFPSVGSGGLIVGGGWGRGVVYEQDKLIGFADITQANVGLTAGGQRFKQLIVFADKAALDRFKANQLAFDANMSAVALTAGAAQAANFRNGVVVFSQPIGGLMVAANVGGQRFRFQPL
jgi:lipid-binding SYLF domain-containing protein